MCKILCQNPWCGPHGNSGSVIELHSNYFGEIILTYSWVWKRESIIHHSMGLFIVLCYWNMMAPLLSCHNDNWCAYFLCASGGWWNSKQTLFLGKKQYFIKPASSLKKHLQKITVSTIKMSVHTLDFWDGLFIMSHIKNIKVSSSKITCVCVCV